MFQPECNNFQLSDYDASQKFLFCHLPGTCSMTWNSYLNLRQQLPEKGFYNAMLRLQAAWPKAGNECVCGCFRAQSSEIGPWGSVGTQAQFRLLHAA